MLNFFLEINSYEKHKKITNNQKTFFIGGLLILIGILLIQTANWYIFLYLLQNNDISVIVPLNQIFIVIFSSLLGYLLLNEKITNKKVFGIFLTGISIFLINVK